MAPIYNFLFTLKTMLTEEREKGATAVEYGLVVGLISLAIVVGAGILGGGINTIFTNIGNYLTGLPIP